MELTLEQLTRIMPQLQLDKARTYLPHLNQAMAEGQINTCNRIAAFLGNVAVESNQLKWHVELWGPSESQKRYEPPNELAAKLGNTQPGDGKRYLGRSIVQITGRANYQACSNDLNVDFINHPELMAMPEYTFKVAVWFWNKHKLNELSDGCEFDKIVKIVNGAYTALEQRRGFYVTALKVLDPDNQGSGIDGSKP